MEIQTECLATEFIFQGVISYFIDTTDNMVSMLPSLSQEAMEQHLFHDIESDEDDELEIEELRDAEYIVQHEDESSDSDYSEDRVARFSRPKQAKRARGRDGRGRCPPSLSRATHSPAIPASHVAAIPDAGVLASSASHITGPSADPADPDDSRVTTAVATNTVALFLAGDDDVPVPITSPAG